MEIGFDCRWKWDGDGIWIVIGDEMGMKFGFWMEMGLRVKSRG